MGIASATIADSALLRQLHAWHTRWIPAFTWQVFVVLALLALISTFRRTINTVLEHATVADG
jgi:hypothetical protein